ncbi:MAG: RNA polymerase sigma factor [Solirubrobacteraceae bacterium]
MASLDSLPADHRAVLQLVLQRGRSYDDIAQLLSIDRAAVRERALSALDALGPQAGVGPERRALITDYLLRQLPPQVSDATRDRLAKTPGERAWARVVASELAPLVTGSLPEIPAETTRREPARAAHLPSRERPPAASPARPQMSSGEPPSEPPSSRAGGAVLLGAGALLIVAVVVAVILLANGGSPHKTASTGASLPTPTTSTPVASAPTGTTTATTSTSTATAKPIAQVNLLSPTGAKTPAGVAVIVKQGTTTGLVIRAQGVPANTRHDAYAVWLYNSPSDTHILGFVNPGVTATKVLQTAGPLPTNAAHFKQLLVTIETQGKPKGPGKIVLQGALSLH